MRPGLAFSVFSVFLTACHSPEPIYHDWMTGRDSVGFLSLEEHTSMCFDCVVLGNETVIGEADGPNAIEWTAWATVDGWGRYWLTQSDEIWIFSPAGEFLKEVGRSGEGPLEWRTPIPSHTDPAGNVHIIDMGNVRESVVSPEFELREERRIPVGDLNSIAPLPGSGRYVVNMREIAETGPLFPLHISAGDTILRSFGTSVEPIREEFSKIRREIAAAADGRIFSAKENHYEIEIWTEGGDRIGGLLGPRLNELEVKPTLYNRTDNPIPSKVQGIQVLDSNRLLVIIRRPKEDWQRHYHDRTYPDGSVGLVMRVGSTADSVYLTQFDLLDLPSRMIVARTEMDGTFSGFAGPRTVLEDRSQGQLVPRLAFWTVDVELDEAGR